MSDEGITETPRRVQLSRKKGWRKPENTVVVARPSRWGNPFKITEHVTRAEAVSMFRGLVTDDIDAWLNRTTELRRIGISASDYDWPYPTDLITTLAGKNLACWCPLNQPCHADVLLELANPGPAHGVIA